MAQKKRNNDLKVFMRYGREMLKLVAEGYVDEEVADELSISERPVRHWLLRAETLSLVALIPGESFLSGCPPDGLRRHCISCGLALTYNSVFRIFNPTKKRVLIIKPKSGIHRCIFP